MAPGSYTLTTHPPIIEATPSTQGHEAVAHGEVRRNAVKSSISKLLMPLLAPKSGRRAPRRRASPPDPRARDKHRSATPASDIPRHLSLACRSYLHSILHQRVGAGKPLPSRRLGTIPSALDRDLSVTRLYLPSLPTVRALGPDLSRTIVYCYYTFECLQTTWQ